MNRKSFLKRMFVGAGALVASPKLLVEGKDKASEVNGLIGDGKNYAGSLSNGDSFTIEFDRPVTGFTKDDIVLTGGTIREVNGGPNAFQIIYRR